MFSIYLLEFVGVTFLAFLISSWAIYNYKSLSFLVSDEWEESILRILSKSISPSFDSNSSVYLD
jgi:hypothetical protein